MAIALRKGHAGGPMWPSIATASFVSTLANWALVASLGVRRHSDIANRVDG
jgi:hypothetical protein